MAGLQREIVTERNAPPSRGVSDERWKRWVFRHNWVCHVDGMFLRGIRTILHFLNTVLRNSSIATRSSEYPGIFFNSSIAFSCAFLLDFAYVS